jgi:Leucine-rich repeat (LRR) protein
VKKYHKGVYVKSFSFLLSILPVIICSSQRYTSLDKALENIKGIRILDLSKDGLNEIPQEVFQLVNLEELILFKNKIKQIPPQIKDLKRLKWLALSRNEIESLPPEIGDLKMLENLSLI